MTPVFADTSYYLALLSKDDAHHEEAIYWSEETAQPVVLTEFILLELGNALSSPDSRRLFVGLVESLRSDKDTLIVPASSELLERGYRLFVQRPDRAWSLTDCISFVAMEERRLTDALTSDAHFRQAGFTVLLA